MQMSYSLPEAAKFLNYSMSELLSGVLNERNNFLYIILSSKDHVEIKKPCVYRLHPNFIIDLMHVYGNLDDYELEIEVFPMIRKNNDCFYLLSLQDIVNIIPSGPARKIKGPMVEEHIPGIEDKLAWQKIVDANYDECRLVNKQSAPIAIQGGNNILLRVKIDLNSIFITSDSDIIRSNVFNGEIPWKYNHKNPECAPKLKYLYKMTRLICSSKKTFLSTAVRSVLEEEGIDPSEDCIKTYTGFLNTKTSSTKA